MTDDQGDEIIRLLRDLVEEISNMRTEFLEFSSHNVYNIKALRDDLTGPVGYHLGDLHEIMGEVVLGLAAVESAITLK